MMEFDLTEKGTAHALQYLRGLKGVENSIDELKVLYLGQHSSPQVRGNVIRVLTPYVNNKETRQYLRQFLFDRDPMVVALADELFYGRQTSEDNPNNAEKIAKKSKGYINLETKLGSSEFKLIREKITKRQILNGLDWGRSHYALAGNGLYMTSPLEMIRYFISVPQSCFTWLDAKFTPNKKGFLGLQLETEHRIVDGKLTAQRIEPLEECLNENCFAELDSLNSQGLPTKKSKFQEYSQGNNILFWCPVDGKVAGFDANSSRAYLYCNGSPLFSVPVLGVFGCVKGKK